MLLTVTTGLESPQCTISLRDDESSQNISTWPDGSHDGAGGFEHGLIDGPLVWAELAVGWEGAGDVGGVAVILSAHVEQTAGDNNVTRWFS